MNRAPAAHSRLEELPLELLCTWVGPRLGAHATACLRSCSRALRSAVDAVLMRPHLAVELGAEELLQLPAEEPGAVTAGAGAAEGYRVHSFSGSSQLGLLCRLLHAAHNITSLSLGVHSQHQPQLQTDPGSQASAKPKPKARAQAPKGRKAQLASQQPQQQASACVTRCPSPALSPSALAAALQRLGAASQGRLKRLSLCFTHQPGATPVQSGSGHILIWGPETMSAVAAAFPHLTHLHLTWVLLPSPKPAKLHHQEPNHKDGPTVWAQAFQALSPSLRHLCLCWCLPGAEAAAGLHWACELLQQCIACAAGMGSARAASFASLSLRIEDGPPQAGLATGFDTPLQGKAQASHTGAASSRPSAPSLDSAQPSSHQRPLPSPQLQHLKLVLPSGWGVEPTGRGGGGQEGYACVMQWRKLLLGVLEQCRAGLLMQSQQPQQQQQQHQQQQQEGPRPLRSLALPWSCLGLRMQRLPALAPGLHRLALEGAPGSLPHTFGAPGSAGAWGAGPGASGLGRSGSGGGVGMQYQQHHQQQCQAAAGEEGEEVPPDEASEWETEQAVDFVVTVMRMPELRELRVAGWLLRLGISTLALDPEGPDLPPGLLHHLHRLELSGGSLARELSLLLTSGWLAPACQVLLLPGAPVRCRCVPEAAGVEADVRALQAHPGGVFYAALPVLHGACSCCDAAADSRQMGQQDASTRSARADEGTQEQEHVCMCETCRSQGAPGQANMLQLHASSALAMPGSLAAAALTRALSGLKGLALPGACAAAATAVAIAVAGSDSVQAPVSMPPNSLVFRTRSKRSEAAQTATDVAASTATAAEAVAAASPGAPASAPGGVLDLDSLLQHRDNLSSIRGLQTLQIGCQGCGASEALLQQLVTGLTHLSSALASGRMPLLEQVVLRGVDGQLAGSQGFQRALVSIAGAKDELTVAAWGGHRVQVIVQPRCGMDGWACKRAVAAVKSLVRDPESVQCCA